MTAALLDINVLLALFDADHVDHERAHRWLDREVAAGWASCAITQNGFVRIISQPRYPNPVPTAEAVRRLARACDTQSHSFWPCDVSLVDADRLDRERMHGPRQVTDAYLLSLAVRHGGRFVTFDQAVPLSAVVGASVDHLVVL